jgi:hypothetical protein
VDFTCEHKGIELLILAIMAKLSIEHCKKVLNKNGETYSDEHVKKIRDFLYFFAELEHEEFCRRQQDRRQKLTN